MLFRSMSIYKICYPIKESINSLKPIAIDHSPERGENKKKM